jgi:hypothetical protein
VVLFSLFGIRTVRCMGWCLFGIILFSFFARMIFSVFFTVNYVLIFVWVLYVLSRVSNRSLCHGMCNIGKGELIQVVRMVLTSIVDLYSQFAGNND